MAYLLDTNIVSDLVRHPQGRVAQRIREVGEDQRGQPIGGNDLLIAAQVVALGHILVTEHEREFERIDDLRCENWLRQA